jgi:hypothetical protein
MQRVKAANDSANLFHPGMIARAGQAGVIAPASAAVSFVVSFA